MNTRAPEQRTSNKVKQDKMQAQDLSQWRSLSCILFKLSQSATVSTLVPQFDKVIVTDREGIMACFLAL
jgi:hypothetical protein